ncbi:MAG: TVP38/TMEM64 family protein [Haloarculaceae archaeon]
MAEIRDRVAALVGDRRVFASPAARRRFLGHAAIVLGLLLALAVVLHRYAAFLSDPATARAFVRGFGVWGPVVLVAVQAAQVVVAPIPGQVLAVVAGYLYGTWWGTLYNLLGVTIGSTIAFWLARRFGRSYVESVVSEGALATFDGVDDTHARLGLFVAFLVPGLPDDLLCFVGGLTTVPLWQLVVIAIVGRAPAFFLVNAIGDLLGAARFGPAIALVAVLAIAAAVGYRYRRPLLALLSEDSRERR